MGYCKDLTNKRFERLLVLKRIENKIYKGNVSKVQWLCKCDCDGKLVKVTSDALLSGGTKSCGCLGRLNAKIGASKANSKHRKSHTRLYSIYDGMKQRCYNSNHMYYKNYGGRGILICDEWLNKENEFINFFNWAIENNYKDNLTIDRINNDFNYCPDNCRWIIQKEQDSNRRTNVNIIYNFQTKTLKEWSEITNINYATLQNRYKKGERGDRLFRKVEYHNSEHQSGVHGVIWDKHSAKWMVGIYDHSEYIYLGLYDDLEEAISVRHQAEGDHSSRYIEGC